MGFRSWNRAPKQCTTNQISATYITAQAACVLVGLGMEEMVLTVSWGQVIAIEVKDVSQKGYNGLVIPIIYNLF